MNNRIEELKAQAQKEVWGTNPFNGAPELDGYELDDDKFAELIILECIKIVNLWSDDEPCAEGYDIGLVWQIKNDFGMNEQ